MLIMKMNIGINRIEVIIDGSMVKIVGVKVVFVVILRMVWVVIDS